MRSDRLVFGAILSFALIASGCASQNKTAMHVYQSPLLAAETPTPRPADRTFDPTRPGDYPESERVVADSRSSSWEKPKKAVAKKAARSNGRKAKIALSVGAGGRSGQPSSSAESGDFSPALAAEYAWRTFEINGAALPETAIHSIPAMWETCRASGHTTQAGPLPGDAIFFHNVFDGNVDGRNNDWYTHVGIVESVRSDGTATVMSYIGGKVVRIWANPGKPDELGDESTPVNSRLRIPTSDDAPFTQYHAGQLFAGYCSMLGDKQQVVVMDDWQPER